MNARSRFACIAVLLTVSGGNALADAQKPEEPGPWKFGVIAGLNFSQSAFSNNWAGGDKGAIVWVVNSDLTAQRQVSTRFNLSNLLQLAFGQTARQVPDANGNLSWDTPDKTTDLIAFESVGRWTLGAFVDPYFALRLDSQFLDQSNPLGEIRFNPIKLKESAGVARVLMKSEDSEAITRLGFGLRQTIARTFVILVSASPTTLEKVSFTANDGGIEWQTSVTQPVLGKKVLYKGQLLVFQPVFYSKSDALDAFDAQAIAASPGREPVSNFWKSPDISFQNTFTAAITKVLSVNLYAQLVYDKFDSAANVDPSRGVYDQISEIDRNIRKAGQFKETLSVGLSYRLF